MKKSQNRLIQSLISFKNSQPKFDKTVDHHLPPKRRRSPPKEHLPWENKVSEFLDKLKIPVQMAAPVVAQSAPILVPDYLPPSLPANLPPILPPSLPRTDWQRID